MMPVLAILLVTGLLVGIGALVLFARVHRWLVRPLVISGAFAFVILGIRYTGGFGTVDPAILSSIGVEGSAAMEERCEKLTELLRQNRVLRNDALRADAVEVASDRWQQLPEGVRAVAKSCLAQEKGVAPEALILIENGNAAR